MRIERESARRVRAALALALLSAGLGGCYVPRPVGHTQLRISADGSYTVNGVQVAPQDLSARLNPIPPEVENGIVEIEATPATAARAILFAVDAVKRAHARVAFASGIDSNQGRHDGP
jgi:hypothetical protein